MPLSRIIPAALHDAVLAKLGELNPDTRRPYTNREVAAWLGDTHGVQCSHMAVLRLAAAVRKDGEEFAAKVLRQAFVDAIDPLRARVLRMAKEVEDAAKGDEADAMKKAVALRAVTGALDTVARFGGLVGASARVDVKGKTDGLAITFYLPAKHDDPDDGGEPVD